MIKFLHESYLWRFSIFLYLYMKIRVAPVMEASGGWNNLFDGRRLEFPDSFKHLTHLTFLYLKLVRIMDMLILTSPTARIIPARRFNPKRGGPHDFRYYPSQVFFPFLRNCNLKPVPVNGEGNKNDHIIDMSYAASPKSNRLNGYIYNISDSGHLHFHSPAVSFDDYVILSLPLHKLQQILAAGFHPLFYFPLQPK
jgi:hypothetical protein